MVDKIHTLHVYMNFINHLFGNSKVINFLLGFQ